MWLAVWRLLIYSYFIAAVVSVMCRLTFDKRPLTFCERIHCSELKSLPPEAIEFGALLKSGGDKHSAQCANWKYPRSFKTDGASVIQHQRLGNWPRAMAYPTSVGIVCYGLMAICISTNVIALLGRKDTAYYLHLYTLVSQNVRLVFGKNKKGTNAPYILVR